MGCSLILYYLWNSDVCTRCVICDCDLRCDTIVKGEESVNYSWWRLVCINSNCTACYLCICMLRSYYDRTDSCNVCGIPAAVMNMCCKDIAFRFLKIIKWENQLPVVVLMHVNKSLLTHTIANQDIYYPAGYFYDRSMYDIPSVTYQQHFSRIILQNHACVSNTSSVYIAMQELNYAKW